MSSYSKIFVVDHPHEYDKSTFLKIYSLESVFKNLRICGRKRHVQTEEKISVFENIWIRVDVALEC